MWKKSLSDGKWRQIRIAKERSQSLVYIEKEFIRDPIEKGMKKDYK